MLCSVVTVRALFLNDPGDKTLPGREHPVAIVVQPAITAKATHINLSVAMIAQLTVLASG